MRCTISSLVILLALHPGADAQTFLGKDRLAWMRQLEGDTPAARRAAAFALGKLGVRDGSIFNALLNRLNDPAEDPSVLDMAAASFGNLVLDMSFNASPETQEFVDLLTRLAKENGDARVRRARSMHSELAEFWPNRHVLR